MNRRCIYEDCSWTWGVYGEHNQEQVDALFTRAFTNHLQLMHDFRACGSMKLTLSRRQVPDGPRFTVGMNLTQLRRHVAYADWYSAWAERIGDAEEADAARKDRHAYRSFIEEKALS